MRAEAYRTTAFAHDLQYLDKDEYGVIGYLKEFELFGRSPSSKGISNLCHRKSHSLDYEVNMFDYKYTIMVGKTPVTYRQTIYFVNSKSLDLPIFMMKPENLMHRLGTYFGIDDIDFEDYPVFSDTYLLKGEDEDYVRHHFDDKILKFFSNTTGWTIEASNFYLLFYRDKELIPVEELSDFFKMGEGVYALFRD
jgi:hypothetical protein